MSKAKQTRRMARKLGLSPRYGVAMARRPHGFAQTRRVGEDGETRCGDIIVGRREEYDNAHLRTRPAQRRKCGDCSSFGGRMSGAQKRYGCGQVIEYHRSNESELSDDGELFDGPEPSIEFGSRIDEIRAARNAALGLS